MKIVFFQDCWTYFMCDHILFLNCKTSLHFQTCFISFVNRQTPNFLFEETSHENLLWNYFKHQYWISSYVFYKHFIKDLIEISSYYCPEGTAFMIPCPRGTYNPDRSGASLAEACKPCDPGKYCNGTGLTDVSGRLPVTNI